MPKRPSTYSQEEITKLMQAAGWEARKNGTHMILSKPNHRNFTITDPVNRNGIAEIQKEIGLHISQLIEKTKGSTSLTRSELIKRLTIAKQLREAGFDIQYINKLVKITALYNYGFSIKHLDVLTPEQVADSIIKNRQVAKGIKIRPAAPEPKPELTDGFKQQIAEEKEIKQTTDLDAMLDVLAPIERHLETIMRTDRLSLLGRYLDKLQLSLADMKELQGHLTKVTEIVNRISERLEVGE